MVSISLNCPEIADISLAILFFVKQVTESVLFKRLCPNILAAVSRGIPFSEAIVVANVRRAEKVVIVLFMPHSAAISRNRIFITGKGKSGNNPPSSCCPLYFLIIL